LERFSEGARRLGLAEDTAVALFSQGLEVAARFEEKESEPIEPEVAPAESKPVEQVWTGKRAEIRATGKNWEESMVQSLLEAIDSELARMEPTLAQWGARNLPGKLVITEVKDQSDEARQHAKLVRLEEGELNALLKAIQEGRPVADRLEFLPPESVFRPLAGKLDPTGESVAFFGDATAHIAEFFRLYTMEDSRVRMEQWERAKVYLSDRIADPGFEVGTAMLDASAGSKFFSGLLGRLHDDYGGNSFLERFFGDELIKQPEPEGPEEAVDLFVVAASLAAGENLLPLFKEELRWPLTSNATDQLREFFPPEDASDEMRTEFRPAPDALLGAWDENYRTEIFPSSLEHRNRLAELRSQYREALSRKGSEHEKAGRAAAAKIYKEEQDRVGPGYEGPVAFNPTLHKALEPEAQAAVRELYAALGRTYRERLRSISTEANSSARGKLTRALDELYRLQHLFTLEGKDEAARWAYDRRRREVGIFSLGSVYSPKFSLDFELKYEEMIRWAVEEEAAVDVVQPITPTSVQRYTVRSIADVQAGRFVWQRLKILGIQRGAVAKPWSDIHLELVSHFEDLERLECGCEELRASTLRAIAGLEELESLSLSGLKVSAKEAAGLAALGNRELKKLNLTGATLPEGALSTLAVGMIARSLEELSLANTNVIDIMPLADFRELERLDITGCEVPQENIEEFTRKMQDCLVVR
ncbi:MAG: leucine-rich repeat domain-containing protein, partial [Verrucomicrobiota bacterium]